MRTLRKRVADPVERGVVGTGGKCRTAWNIHIAFGGSGVGRFCAPFAARSVCVSARGMREDGQIQSKEIRDS